MPRIESEKRERIDRWAGLGLTAAIALASALGGASPAAAGDLPADLFTELRFRHVGPLGNRVSAVAGVPGDPKTYFVGAASGGVFRSIDGGAHWQPVFDDQPVASIGALAVAPSDPNVVWAGTGEAHIRSNVSIGNGVYRSLDGGTTWTHMGLAATGRVSRIVIDPRDSRTVFVAALGHCYGPQAERGVFRTRDGGESWEKVLSVDEDTGASDLAIDPGNPRILFAGTWQMVIWPWGRQSGGPGSGIYRSTDGGDSWQRLAGSGLPQGPWGKVALAVSGADSRRVYALIETSSNRDFAPVGPEGEFQGVLWRSDDGGDRWRVVSKDNTLVQRPLYYTRVVAAPDDADEVSFLAVQMSRSLDGGSTYERVEAGGDHHDLWIDPVDPDRLIVGHDQGVSISLNRGESWARPQLPIAQMYHVATDGRIPYFLYGNRQDGPSTRGPSNSLTAGPIPVGAWSPVGGCETGFALPDPSDPERVWTGCYDGILERFDLASGQARDVSVWPEAVEATEAAELRYRFQWTFPIAASPHRPGTIYAGSQHVHETSDGGQSWRVISPDLTGDEADKQRRFGGLTLDDAGPTIAPTLFALAESPREPGLIWAGTNDGRVQVTRDGGESWTDLTDRLQDLPPWGAVSNVEPSRHAAGVAYLTVDRHQMGDAEPYVYKTDDYGASWRRIDGGIPRGTHSYAHCVREDPRRPGLLYLGTENELYVSLDDGASWRPLDAGLPPAPVHWITVEEHFHDLVVATYGRGFWILDDATPLVELDEATLAAAVHLFRPRPAYRFRLAEAAMQQPEDPAAGTNPDYGAVLHYRLAEKAESVELEIVDADGEVVRALDDAPTGAGLHRVVWDLLSDPTTEPELRTPPEEAPFVALGDEGHRRLSDGGRLRLLMPPGRYTVRLRVGDTELSRGLEVLADPRSHASAADFAEQHELLTAIRERVEEAAGLINDIEWLRKQADDLAARIAGRQREDGEVTEAIERLSGELRAIEGELFDLRLTGARQDILRWPRLLYAKLTYLAFRIGRSDHRPTDPQREVYALLAERLASLLDRFSGVEEGELAELNRLLAERGLAGIL